MLKYVHASVLNFKKCYSSKYKIVSHFWFHGNKRKIITLIIIMPILLIVNQLYPFTAGYSTAREQIYIKTQVHT